MKPRQPRSRIILIGVLGVLFAGWLQQSGVSTFFQLRDAWRAEAALEHEVRELQESNTELRAEIEALGDNGEAVEKIAREKLRYVKDGEVLVVLPEQP